jgi:hypothetical protein
MSTAEQYWSKRTAGFIRPQAKNSPLPVTFDLFGDGKWGTYTAELWLAAFRGHQR